MEMLGREKNEDNRQEYMEVKFDKFTKGQLWKTASF
jgi:hypothetical protein